MHRAPHARLADAPPRPVRSDTTVAPNNGVWGAPKTPSGASPCAIPSNWVNFTCVKSGAAYVTAGGAACTPWSYVDWTGTTQNVSFSINYTGTGAASYAGSPAIGGQVANANGYFPGTPAPCWANTAPTSYSLPPGATSYNGYSVADASGTRQVPHFLDFGSVLYKDVNGVVHRQAIPPGRCLPGNLVNVKTSAVAYNKATLTVLPVFPSAQTMAYPTGANQIITTSQDVESAAGLTVYTPGSKQPTPNLNNGNGGQPATMNAIRVYFALNFGLRNALDNACDGRNKTSAKACINGGFYVSNLTTALLGDASKGLGRATYAVIRLCHSPMSTTDRPWRKKSGDAVNNKQCMDVKQVLFGTETELANDPVAGTNSTPNAVLGGGGKLMMMQPLNAVTGLAVNDVPLGAYTDGNVDPVTGAPTAVKSGYYVTNAAGVTNVSAPSPVAFCRPLADASQPSGVDPDSRKGVFWFKNTSGMFCQKNQLTDNTPVSCADNCVLSGSSWSTTKGTNVNLNDPAWYTVDILLPEDMPKGNYFVRVFALDANGSYLGFGSSATSANLTNTATQNYFHVDRWASWSSAGKRGSHIADIRAGAAGCSAMSLLVGALFFVREIRMARRNTARSTEVVGAEPAKAAAPEAAPEAAAPGATS